MEAKTLEIGFVGAGKVGSALAILLQRAGYRIAGVASRTGESANKLATRLNCPVLSKEDVAKRSEVLFITTSDDAIASVAQEIAEKDGFRSEQIVLHMSGAHTAQLLEPAAEKGAINISVHPIQSFASVEQAITLIPGTYFSIEGDTRGYSFAQEMVEKLGGKHFKLDSNSKVLYHAAASVASNYLVGLLKTALDLLAAAGVPEEVRLPAFLPLVEGTLENIKKLGIPQALTGPISRGDLGTLEKHLDAMKELPELLRVYRTLGLVTVDAALKKGTINEKQATAIRSLLKNNWQGLH
ncbi:MAG: DUF2520 domain-containing protein [Syntrophomonadaceae bacterium]|jgi:predicted short-subunit dehydrogenase-like oxidoreductase (DUF2520 family)|nr:DUF2520 domain-containing protein [Syntrophomonadaceae bacterium]HAF17813.1 DUF2520 domain-containing protein [Peptococcaceae bacterium]